ncbi:MAG: dihydroxyacetone kinase family protein [Beutenbergiaceae bacterium]
MTYIFDDPAEFADDALDGLCDAHPELVRRVDGGVVRSFRSPDPKVAVIYGGGSGHYPAFAGLVGPGMGAGAVCGNIFTSPSMQQAISVARAAEQGRGVIFSYGNYAGDVMNFGRATEQLLAQSIRAANVIVTDDIASAPVGQESMRRGIAGDFTVYKVLGAAAERGDDVDEVLRLGNHANAMTRSIGVAFDGCTFPGALEPLFTVPAGHMGLGLGIHGEPGLKDVPLPSAHELAALLVEHVLAEKPAQAGNRVAVILNGLGATKHEELFVLWKSVAALLRSSGLQICAPEIGEIVTSLDMAGTSLTLMYLDDELEPLWLAPAHTPGYTRGAIESAARIPTSVDPSAAKVERRSGSQRSQHCAHRILALLEAVGEALHAAEPSLGQLDAIAGDGDHGRGMVKGIDAACSAARQAVDQGYGAGDTVTEAGAAWAAKAGGTSGVLWGEGLQALGAVLGNTDDVDTDRVVQAVQAFADRLADLGGAVVGDKTMVDALTPFTHALATATVPSGSLAQAWQVAAQTAAAAAHDTADLIPRKGRARPLAEKSRGRPDPGAVSFALIATTIGENL